MLACSLPISPRMKLLTTASYRLLRCFVVGATCCYLVSS